MRPAAVTLLFAIIAACADQPYVILTISDPQGVASGADTLDFGTEEEGTIQSRSLSALPATAALSASSGKKELWVQARKDGAIVAMGRVTIDFAIQSDISVSVALKQMCTSSEQCDNGAYCDGAEHCARDLCEAGPEPCPPLAGGCGGLKCMEQDRGCVVAVSEGLIDGDPCSLDICVDGAGAHDVSAATDAMPCDIGTLDLRVCDQGKCVPSTCGDRIVDPRTENCEEGDAGCAGCWASWVQLAPVGHTPQISPDGRFVAYVVPRTDEDIDDERLKELTVLKDRYGRRKLLTISDGARAPYDRDYPRQDRPIAVAAGGVAVAYVNLSSYLDSDGSEVFVSRFDYVALPDSNVKRISVDGRPIGFTANGRSVAYVEAENGRLTLLLDLVSKEESIIFDVGRTYNPAVHMSDDARVLAFGGDGSGTAVGDADSGELTFVSSFARGPRVCASGEYFVVSENWSHSQAWPFAIIVYDRRVRRPVTISDINVASTEPDISQYGENVAYTQADTIKRWTRAPVGTETICGPTLPASGPCSQPRISNDGRTVVFRSNGAIYVWQAR